MWSGTSVPLDSQRRARPDDQSFRTRLTPAERAVAKLMDEGKLPAEIAQLRGTSVKTARCQMETVRAKRQSMC